MDFFRRGLDLVAYLGNGVLVFNDRAGKRIVLARIARDGVPVGGEGSERP